MRTRSNRSSTGVHAVSPDGVLTRIERQLAGGRDQRRGDTVGDDHGDFDGVAVAEPGSGKTAVGGSNVGADKGPPLIWFTVEAENGTEAAVSLAFSPT
jgi:hypothetical protein